MLKKYKTNIDKTERTRYTDIINSSNCSNMRLIMRKKANETQQPEEAKIKLWPPRPFDDKSFKDMLVKNVFENDPEYVTDVALRSGLSSEKDMPALEQAVYDEQMSVIVEKCIETALDENTVETYGLLQNICNFDEKDMAYMATVEGEDLPANVVKYIDRRLENVTYLSPVLKFTRAVNEAVLFSTSDAPGFTSYKANQLKEQFENTGLYLSEDEKGKLYFIASKMYRKLSANNPLANDIASEQECECLRKVLALSADYNLISYCQNRLPTDKKDKSVVRAYKHALTKTKNRGDLYKINAELGNLYAARSRTIGFTTPNSDKNTSSAKAVKYMLSAYRYAAKEDKLPLLRKIADVQLSTGSLEDWKSTKSVIAYKFLKNEERCYALNAIGDRTGDISYYEQSVAECQKSKMPKMAKLSVLEITYEKLCQQTADAQQKQELQQKLQEIRNEKKTAVYDFLNGDRRKGSGRQ